MSNMLLILMFNSLCVNLPRSRNIPDSFLAPLITVHLILFLFFVVQNGPSSNEESNTVCLKQPSTHYEYQTPRQWSTGICCLEIFLAKNYFCC